MKKVLFFIESLAGGGAEKVLSDIVSNLDKEKFDVTVYTVTDEGVYQDRVSQNCEYRSFLHERNYKAGGLRKVFFWLGIKLIYSLPPSLIYRLFIHGKYDTEIAFVEGFATKLIAASNNPNSKKLAWVHCDMCNNAFADSRFKNHAEHMAAYHKYDRIFCVSESVRTAFANKYFDSDCLQVQYNPVDEEAVVDMSKDEICMMTDIRPLLVSVGRLEHQKGYLRLLESAKLVRDEGYNFSICIIGEGSERAKLEAKIREYHLENTVHLLGFQKNPYKYVAKCDGFICSSYAEGFSTAATESLILGKPIFTVDCAGMGELFGSEKCGIIVENNDQALSQLLREIASGEVHLEEYASAVKRRSSDFKIKTRMQEIQNLFE